MSTMLITGATGMLGSHVMLGALEEGWKVRALVRCPSKAAWLAARGVELAVGDIRDAGAVRHAARGCGAVVHTAAAIGSGREPGHFFRGNVLGTEHVLVAAREASARLVHVSSTAVVGSARYRCAEPTTEDMPLPELPAWDAYGRTKQAAECRVLEASRRGDVWATVVRPPMMYGCRDRQFVPRVAPVVERGYAPIIAGGATTLPLVHAASVAAGILTSLRHDRAVGRVYHLTEDRPVTVRMLVEAAVRGLGGTARAVEVPRPVARGGFLALAGALSLVGRVDLARHARGSYLTLTRDNPFSAERARRELGWHPDIDPAQALEDAFGWWSARRRAGGGS